MAARGSSMILRVCTGLVAAGALSCAAPAPAAAGFFERLFGGFQHHAPAAPAFANPFDDFFRPPSRPQREATPTSGHCVRTSDGFHFPVQAQGGMSAAAMCRSLCPGSPTKVYYGARIDNATAADGSHYADLDTAFLYRTKLVAGSTCNGRNVFGLAHLDVKSDPTLRPGDVVATRQGLVAVSSSKGGDVEFTPVADNRAVPKQEREQLSAVKIMPTPRGVNGRPVALGLATGDGENRSAQLSR